MKYSVGISGQRKHTIDRLGIIRKFNQKLFFPDGRQQQRHDRRRIVFQRVVSAADTPVVHETALGDRVNGLKDFLVKASTACIILVEGLCVGPNRDQFTTHGVTVVLVTVLAVALHHVLGLLAGYVTAKVFRFNEKKVRTLSLEVGLQNSGLSCTLAKTAFPDLAKNISMTMTPMVFTARMMKQADPEARMCFIGPCAAKKLEASRRTVRSDVDFVLTFEELAGIIEAKDLDLDLSLIHI